MSSHDQTESTSDQKSAPQNIPESSPRAQAEMPTPSPVEMKSLDSKTTPAQPEATSPNHPTTPPGPVRTDTATALEQFNAASPSTPPPTIPEATGDPVTQTTSTAIGPSSDQPVVPSKDSESSGPVLLITLLLTSGARHPFKLDGRYLQKRNVDVAGNDPFNLSVYKLKELILREWREDWEQKPASPSSIRLISFGKLLDDKAPLTDSKFSPDTPNVLHMTIKPQDFVEEEDAKGGKASYSAQRDGEGRSPRCRCVVM